MKLVLSFFPYFEKSRYCPSIFNSFFFLITYSFLVYILNKAQSTFSFLIFRILAIYLLSSFNLKLNLSKLFNLGFKTFLAHLYIKVLQGSMHFTTFILNLNSISKPFRQLRSNGTPVISFINQYYRTIVLYMTNNTPYGLVYSSGSLLWIPIFSW